MALNIQLTSSPSGALKRPRNEDQWKSNAAKKQRNLGLEYLSPKNDKIVPARSVGQPCGCKKNCFDRVGLENIHQIHKQYWASGDWNIQTAYLQSHTAEMDVKRRYGASAKRTCTRQYHVVVASEKIIVCKKAFASIHGINPTRPHNALAKNRNTSAGM